ncbi:uncharacterized protein LOC144037460 isoform X3 [Vanacampus margaritifer]
MDVHDYAMCRKMGQLEELKAFISERLKAVASELLGAVDKTVTEYEEQARRLKEENCRHCSILDLLIKDNKLPRKAGVPEENPHTRKDNLQTPYGKAAARIQTTDSQNCAGPGPDPNVSSPSHVEGTFTSYTEFLNFALGDNCPYCIKPTLATKLHLTKKHYSSAIHFTDNGIGRFIIPCTCKDLIQNRCHYHCPYCERILTRRFNFVGHISKKHGFPIHHPNQGAEINDMPFNPISEADVAPTCDVWGQQEFVFQDRKFPLLPVKIEAPQYSGRQSLGVHTNQDSASSLLYVDSSAQQFNEIQVHSSGVKPLMSKTTTTTTKKKKKKQLRKKTLNRKQKTAIQSDTGVYRCQVCGKTFHYTYTLKSHVWTHLRNKSLCGICGKQMKDAESLVQHLESHTVRKKCGLCGKQFSSATRLKDHWRFHRRNPLDGMTLS